MCHFPILFFSYNASTLPIVICFLLSTERSQEKNFVFSPYSAHSAFSQLLLGSAGSTQAELQKVLGRFTRTTPQAPG